jgi:hypothetical protein
VFFSCSNFVCAIAASWVKRLVLLHEAETLAAPSPDGELVAVAGERHAAFHLGPLLGLPQPSTAWLLLSIPHGGRNVAIALGTGPCLVVQPLALETPLPRGIFRARHASISAAFSVEGMRGAPENAIAGIYLDAGELLTPTELARSAALLAGRAGSP